MALGAPIGHRTLTGTRSNTQTPRWPCTAAKTHHRWCQTRISAVSMVAVGSEIQNHAGAAKKLAVFVSGGGSNMRAIHAATVDGRLAASIEVSITLPSIITLTPASVPHISGPSLGIARAKPFHLFVLLRLLGSGCVPVRGGRLSVLTHVYYFLHK